MTLQVDDSTQVAIGAMESVRGECARSLRFGGAPSAQGCVQLITLGLELLADARDWMAAQSPRFRAPVEAMAFSCAAVSPWRSAAELAPCVRMCVWVCAFDDYIEQTNFAQLNDMLRRCTNIVRGHGPDESHWLLTALSSWQKDVVSRPLYPVLRGLWVEKFEAMLCGMRHEWLTGRSGRRDWSDVNDYLAHADSVAAWTTHLPRWLTYGDGAVLDHLDLLVPAFGDYVVAVRLANDLASYSRERDHPGNDNILMYGLSPEWVRGEIARLAGAAAQRLAELVGAQVLPAVELTRELEYAITFYSVADFRSCSSGTH